MADVCNPRDCPHAESIAELQKSVIALAHLAQSLARIEDSMKNIQEDLKPLGKFFADVDRHERTINDLFPHIDKKDEEIKNKLSASCDTVGNRLEKLEGKIGIHDKTIAVIGFVATAVSIFATTFWSDYKESVKFHAVTDERIAEIKRDLDNFKLMDSKAHATLHEAATKDHR